LSESLVPAAAWRRWSSPQSIIYAMRSAIDRPLRRLSALLTTGAGRLESSN